MKPIRKVLSAAVAVLALPLAAAAAQPAADSQPGDADHRLEEAQERLARAVEEVARLSGELGRRFVFNLQAPGAEVPPRALLGVSIDNAADVKGAVVRDVSPGSAAAEAGMLPGDVITRIDGKDLTTEADPGRALVEKMQQVEPDRKLQVEVLRDGKKQGFDVTPRPAPPIRAFQALQAQAARGQPGIRTFQLQPGADGPGGPGERRIEIRTLRDGPDDGTRFRGLEFATLSEKLGSYFGVKSGVLVVRAGSNPAFKLQDGDVILAIDARVPDSAQHAARILRSYSDGEKFKLKVQRDRKAQEIEVTMPAGGPEDRQR